MRTKFILRTEKRKVDGRRQTAFLQVHELREQVEGHFLDFTGFPSGMTARTLTPAVIPQRRQS
jgi:hypothetical protein